MEQNRSTPADMQRWGQTIPAPSRRTQSMAGVWSPGAGSRHVRPPIQQPDLSVWLDRVRVQLDPTPPSPPLKKRELEWALIAGIAAGVLLLLGGSTYWFLGSNSKKGEVVYVATSRPSMNAAESASVPIARSTPPKRKAPANDITVAEARVPRVTEEAPTLPVQRNSSPARVAATEETGTTAAAPADKEPRPSNSARSRIADTKVETKSAPEQIEEAKLEEPKTARRDPTPVSARPQPVKPAATKLALAEQVAAPIQNAVAAAAAPMPITPAPVIAMPQLKTMRTPNYPVSEMRAGHEGTTTLELLVLETGLVGEVTVLSSSGYPKLDDAAVAVVKRSWRFSPATEDGKPMAMKIQAPVRFSLD